MTTAIAEPTDPDLILRVRQKTLADGRRVLEFEAKARDPRLDLYFMPFDSEPLEGDPKVHFQELLSDIEQLQEGGADWLAGRGSQLFEELIPVELQRRLWGLRNAVRSVQILSDETWLPWELLKLQDPDDPSSSGPYFAEAFSLTRWLLKVPPRVELPLRRIALVIPRDSGLPMSEAEGERLKALAGSSREIIEIPATLSAVKSALESGTYGGWHFTGHGLAWNSGPHHWSIHLEGQEELSAPHLTGSVRRLGQGKPLVFLNACHTGCGAMSLTTVGGLAGAFLKAGAGAFVGSLWSLDDAQACCFAEELYRHLFSGVGIGDAVRAARLALREQFPWGNNWLAYTVFAHPLACSATAPARKARARSKKEPREQVEEKEKTRRPEILAGPAPLRRAGRSRDEEVALPLLDVKPAPRPLEPPAREIVEAPVPAPGAERCQDKDGTVLLYVPGGEFLLGAKDVHPWSKPVHRVRLSPFWIGKFPVTNEQYARFLQENPAQPLPAFWDDPRFNGSRQPVVGVSWDEAQAYCRWAGLELPTEAQWEAAARGADQRPYPWGGEPPTPRHANFGDTSSGTTPVDSYPAGRGPYGTLDQAGNVWEWCADPWSAQAYQLIPEGQLDPIARGDKAVRSLRGGSWNNPAQDLRAAYRDRGTAKVRFNSQGFRCVWRPS